MPKFKSLPAPILPQGFVRLAESIGLVGIDVGARGEINTDLIPIGKGVEWYCLEPDIDAPRDPQTGRWKHVTYIPTAAAAREENISINLYRQRGCSSKFFANPEMAARFSRSAYYELDGNIVLEAKPLDELILSSNERPASFMKIDVQGMEVECFEGARRLLENELLAIRTEVSFIPMYLGQPLFSEVEFALRPYGFQPMRWLEQHDWRRNSRAKLPRLADGELPYSMGQLSHGDVVFMRSPEDLPVDTEQDLKRVIRLGLIAMCYSLFDHAYVSFSQPGVREYCLDRGNFDPLGSIRKISRFFAHRTRASRWLEILAGKLST